MAVKLNTKESVVDYLKSIGEDSSYSARSKLAADMGISNYTGSESQNIQMLNTLKNGSNTSNTNIASDVKKNNAAIGKVVDNPPNEQKDVVDTPSNKLKGVDDSITDKMLSEFTASDESKNADNKSKDALGNLESLTGKTNIISAGTWSDINSSFVVPSAVKEADAWLSNQLELIQSGKTSWSDPLRDIMDKIMNREKFSYDVDTDPLFQQALASAMSSGKQAMQDTIGQASALTGGYGSTYATGAGNQAYNAFIEDAYDNLPQYYQMAMDAYQMEGDEMYRQYGMLSAEDDKEYNRNITAYDATYQHRNQMYNEAYTQHRDSVSDAFAKANLEISEHGQLVSDAYNYYVASSDYSDKVYEREYNSWMDSINQATQYAQLLNSDYWNQKDLDLNYDKMEQDYLMHTEDNELSYKMFTEGNEFTAIENQKDRDFSASESQKGRDFTASENQKDRDHESSENQKGRDFTASENQKDRDFSASESQKGRDFTATENQKDRNLTASENALTRAQDNAQFNATQKAKTETEKKLKSPTEKQMEKALEAYNKGGMDELNKYLNSISDEYDKDAIAEYVGEYGEEPIGKQIINKIKDIFN